MARQSGPEPTQGQKTESGLTVSTAFWQSAKKREEELLEDFACLV